MSLHSDGGPIEVSQVLLALGDEKLLVVVHGALGDVKLAVVVVHGALGNKKLVGVVHVGKAHV